MPIEQPENVVYLGPVAIVSLLGISLVSAAILINKNKMKSG